MEDTCDSSAAQYACDFLGGEGKADEKRKPERDCRLDKPGNSGDSETLGMSERSVTAQEMFGRSGDPDAETKANEVRNISGWRVENHLLWQSQPCPVWPARRVRRASPTLSLLEFEVGRDCLRGCPKWKGTVWSGGRTAPVNPR